MIAPTHPDTGSHRVEVHERHVALVVDGTPMSLHHVWLRDNCWCASCRVLHTAERRLYTAHIPPDIAPTHVHWDGCDAPVLRVTWNDGHESSYSPAWQIGRAHV